MDEKEMTSAWGSPQTVAGIIVALSGVALCFWDFARNNTVGDPALMYLGEVLVWGGSLLGVNGYINYKINKRK